jgi:lipid II:glycine glycyltransferase (peptidoglycan interpeptide bridge formation enzyme)
MRYLQSTLEHQEWNYLEVRPVNGSFDETGHGIGFRPTGQYFLHRIDLQPDLNEIFRHFDKDSVQRRVQRAQRGGLIEKRGRSEELLREFYDLFVLTRGRHHLPPIPMAWFRNLIQTQKDSLEIRLAFKDRTAIAGILTLRFKDYAYYKYGCSDVRFNRFGAIPWLLWNAIADAKASGAKEFDMGRTQDDNEGLLTFKGHWVSHPSRLVYWKYPDSPSLGSANGWKLKAAMQVFSYMPERILRMTGRLIYRHIG